MDYVAWIDKNVVDIQQSHSYQKYFDAVAIEKGVGNYFIFNPEAGIDMVIRENFSVKSIHLYGSHSDKINSFKDPLPFNLQFSFSRNQIIKKLGKPVLSARSGHDTRPDVLAWDTYVFSDYTLNLQFGAGARSVNVLMLAALNG